MYRSWDSGIDKFLGNQGKYSKEKKRVGGKEEVIRTASAVVSIDMVLTGSALSLNHAAAKLREGDWRAGSVCE